LEWEVLSQRGGGGRNACRDVDGFGGCHWPLGKGGEKLGYFGNAGIMLSMSREEL